MNLSPLQFYKWKASLEEMLHIETKLKLSRHNLSMMEKDIELQKLKVALFKSALKDSEALVKDQKERYKLVKEELEKEINMSLDDCSIDDITFEVTKLTDTVTSG